MMRPLLISKTTRLVVVLQVQEMLCLTRGSLILAVTEWYTIFRIGKENPGIKQTITGISSKPIGFHQIHPG